MRKQKKNAVTCKKAAEAGKQEARPGGIAGSPVTGQHSDAALVISRLRKGLSHGLSSLPGTETISFMMPKTTKLCTFIHTLYSPTFLYGKETSHLECYNLPLVLTKRAMK